MSYINNNHCLGWSFAVFQPWLSPSRTKPATWVMDRWWPSMCGWTGRNLDNSLGVSFVNGNFRNLNWRYLPYIRPKFQEIYPQFIWPNIWYSSVPPSVGSWRSPIDQPASSPVTNSCQLSASSLLPSPVEPVSASERPEGPEGPDTSGVPDAA